MFVVVVFFWGGGGSQLSGGYSGARKSMRRSLDFRAPKEFENKPNGREPASRLREGGAGRVRAALWEREGSQKGSSIFISSGLHICLKDRLRECEFLLSLSQSFKGYARLYKPGPCRQTFQVFETAFL